MRLDKNKVSESKAASEFGTGRVVCLEQLPKEYGYITPVMSEKEFAEKFERLDGAISRIRIEG